MLGGNSDAVHRSAEELLQRVTARKSQKPNPAQHRQPS
jgi:hypothetical protein